MAEKLDPRQVATFEELLRACLYEQEALRRVLVRKGVLTNEDVLEEIKVVRRDLEGKGGGRDIENGVRYRAGRGVDEKCCYLFIAKLSACRLR